VLTNTTGTPYQVKQFYVDKVEINGQLKKKIFTFHAADLQPNATIPLPDCDDPEIMKKLKICLRPIGYKKWSDEFVISSLKKKLNCNENIIWNHHRTYSILRKEATENKNVFNFLLLPALVIKNCLPLNIDMTLSMVTPPSDDDGAQSVNTSMLSESCKEVIEEFRFSRGQNRVFDNLSNGSARVEIKIHLNDQKFLPKGILLQ